MLLCQGDLHVSPYIWSKYRDIEGDSVFGLRQFVDRGLRLFEEGKIEVLFFLGDLFDTIAPVTSMVQAVRTQMDRCREAELPVYYIDGNHDKRPTPWLSALHSWPTYVGDGQPFEVGGRTGAALDFTDLGSVEDFVKSLPEEVEMIFLHQQCRQYMDIPGTWDFDLDWVPPTVKLVVMGHVHEDWQFEYAPGSSAYYTGSTHMRAIDQSYEKSSLLVEKDLTTQRLPLLERPIKRFEVEFQAQVDDIREWLRQPNYTTFKPVVHLAYAREILEDILPDLEEIEQHAHLITEPLTYKKRDQEAGEKVRSITLSSIPALLEQIMPQAKHPESFSVVVDIMSQELPVEQVVERHYKAYKD